jgi:hypothetical protein
MRIIDGRVDLCGLATIVSYLRRGCDIDSVRSSSVYSRSPFLINRLRQQFIVRPGTRHRAAVSRSYLRIHGKAHSVPLQLHVIPS